MFKVCAELTVGVEIPSLEVLCGGDWKCEDVDGSHQSHLGSARPERRGERRSRRAASSASRPFIPVLLFKNYCLKSE